MKQCLLRFVATLGLVAAWAIPAAAQDSTLSGEFPVVGGSYNTGDSVPLVCHPDLTCGQANTEFAGWAYVPDPNDAAVQQHVADNGPMPLVVLLHGRHVWCYNPTNGSSGLSPFPCPADQVPVPSYRGYDYIAKVLASHGYHVVSIAANAINAANTAHVERASLIEMHLNVWNQINEGTADPAQFPAPFTQLEGMIDLQRIGTMGHSRGGAGVVAHHDLFRSISPYRVRAVLPLAPTSTSDITSHVPLGLMINECDGDLFDLQGLKYIDGARYADPSDQSAKHSFAVPGANHNFSNTVWTPECWDTGSCPDWDPAWTPTSKPCDLGGSSGCIYTEDDFGSREEAMQASWSISNPGNFPGNPDAYCSPAASPNGRITAAEQRALTLAYTAAFFRYYLGGEQEFGPMLNGDAAAAVDTSQLVRVGYHPPGFRRTDVHSFAYDTADEYLDFPEQMTSTTLPSWVDACGSGSGTNPGCFAPVSSQVPGAFREAHRGGGSLSRAKLSWNGAQELVLPIISGREDITRHTTFQFRAGFDYADASNPDQLDFSIRLTDGDGNTIVAETTDQVGPNALQRPREGTYATVAISSTVRIPLSSFVLTSGASFDYTNVLEIAFLLGSGTGSPQGSVLISDVGFSGEVPELPSDVVVVLDISGSMDAVDFQDVPDNRLEIAVKGVRHFAETLRKGAGNRIALVPYATDADPSPLAFIEIDAAFDAYAAGTPFADKLDAILATGPTTRTSIGDGVDAALSMLVAANSLASARRPAILLFTDGRQNESKCLGIEGVSGVDTGECTPTNPSTDIVTSRDPRLYEVPICSIGLGRTAGQVDERLLETFSTRYLDSQPNGSVPTTSAAEFAKCIPDLAPEGIAIDPSGILPRGSVSAPAFTYESAGDTGLTFVSSWSNSAETEGDMRLFVNAPNGALVRASGADTSLRVDYHNQFVGAPATGSWRFQVGRDVTRVVNAFTSDAFVDGDAGVQLARRQLHRLCPEGCANVLYFEDGRVSSANDSIYAEALAAEQATGLIGSVGSYDASSATSFAYALGASYDALIYIRQLDADPNQTEVYDSALLDVLCETTTPAIVTDTRAPLDAMNLPYQLAGVGSSEPIASLQIHACSGALVNDSDSNYDQLVDKGGTLITGSLDLVDRGYDVFSYGVTALPWDTYSPGIGASQLDVTTDAPVVDTTLGFPSEFGAVVTHSADQAFVCAVSYGAECYNPRDRAVQRWASQVNTRGYAPIKPVIEGTELGDPDGIRVKFCLDRFLPPGGIQSTSAVVQVVYPTVDLDDVLSASTCQGDDSPGGDDIPGNGKSIALEDITLATTSITLKDDGTGGDAVAGDLCFSALAPSLGQVQGTYTFRYYADIDFIDASGNVQTMHREEFATQYVGDEVLANGRLCTPTGGECSADSVPPVIDAGSASSAVSTCSSGAVPVAFQVPTATDNCGMGVVNGAIIQSSDPSLSLPLALSSGTATLKPGTYTIEWVAFDAFGNASAPMEQIVKVQSALAASNSLYIRNDSNVLRAGGYGAVANAGTGLTEIGNNVLVGGVDGAGNVKVWHNAKVHGNLNAGGTYNVEPSAVVYGLKTNGANVSVAVQNLSDVTFPVTPGQITVNSGGVRTFGPGNHPTVYLNSGSKMILEPGDHYFEQLHVNSSTVVVQAQNGTRLFVRTGMAFRAPIVTAAGTLATVFLGYAGTTLTLEANFSGTVIAPNATLRMGTATAQSFSGAAHAKIIDLSNGADFMCIPSTCLGAACGVVVPPNTCNDGIQNGSEQGVDCGGSCSTPCPPACTPSQYEAEAMTHSVGGAIAGGWNLWSNGNISTSHQFFAGTSEIRVTAKGQAAFGWPHMVVRVNNVVVGSAKRGSQRLARLQLPVHEFGWAATHQRGVRQRLLQSAP